MLLEGGAMRGMYTAGVLDVMMEENIKVNGIVAVSAGALFGVNFASNQIGRAIRYNLKFLKEKDYMGLYSLLKTGNIVNKEFAYYKVPINLDPFDQASFAKSNIDFFATVTNLESGQAEYIKIDDVIKQMEVLRASSAMPFVSQIVYLDGIPYLDGGIADSIPLNKILSMNFDKIIVILTRPIDYRKKPANSAIYHLGYRKYPQFIETWKQRSENYNQRIEKINELEAKGDIFVIRPSQYVKIGRIEKNPQALKAMYQLGIEDAKAQLYSLIEYLK